MVSLGQFSKEEIDAFDGLYEDNSIVEFNFCRRDGVNVELTRTKYCQLNVFFLCTTEYPSDMLLIELQSQTIEEELLEKLKKLVCKKLKTLKNQHQIKTALDMFISIMTNNLFLHCKSEIDDIKSLLILTKEKLKNAKKNEEEQQEEESNNNNNNNNTDEEEEEGEEIEGELDEIKLIEKKGKMVLKLYQKKYFLQLRVTVPPMYPEKCIKLEILSTNFPPNILLIFHKRSQSILRKLEIGDQKFDISNYNEENNSKNKNAPTLADLQSFRHDMKFLKKLQDLKKLDHDKKMRRQKTRLVKKESLAIAQNQENDNNNNNNDRDRDEERLFTTYEDREFDKETLFPVVGFYINEFIRRLPSEKCSYCKDYLIPETPFNEVFKPTVTYGGVKKVNTNNDKAIKPLPKKKAINRLFCDHYYHTLCLTKYLSEPPFENKACIVCSKEINHHKFSTEYIKKMEKQYLLKVKRERELADVVDFLGF